MSQILQCKMLLYSCTMTLMENHFTHIPSALYDVQRLNTFASWPESKIKFDGLEQRLSAQHKWYWCTCQRLHWPVEVKNVFLFPSAPHIVYRTEFYEGLWHSRDVQQENRVRALACKQLRRPSSPERRIHTVALILLSSLLQMVHHTILIWLPLCEFIC